MALVTAAMVLKDTISLVVDGHTTTIANSHGNYNEIKILAVSGDYDQIDELLDYKKAIETFGKGRVTVEDGMVLFDGVETHNAVSTRIIQMVEEGLTVGPMLKFLENLMQNPSFRSVQQLYGFLEVNDLPITKDGHFLAYRMCREDWTDHRTGQMDNSIGASPNMPRNQVNEDPNQTCSSGLHVCAQGYLGFYGGGGRTLLVKVNPANVVAVPTDYNNAKMRVCEFTVMSEVNNDTRGSVNTSAVYDEDVIDNNTIASSDDLLTREQACIHFDCNDAALRKRLRRGVSAVEAFVGGVSMVQVIVDKTAEPVSVKDDTVMTHEQAMEYFSDLNILAGQDIPDNEKAALRKRLNRGKTAKRVYVGGVEYVKVL